MPDHPATPVELHVETVTHLLDHLDPQYRVEGLNDDGDIDPDWNKIENLANLMRTGAFDFDAAPLLMVGNPNGDKMVFDGNHRLLAADLANVDTMPTLYTTRPLG